MELITVEELKILMRVAGSDDPMQTAMQLRARWRYLLGLARAARHGMRLDEAFPEVMEASEDYVERAQGVLKALDEWLQAQPKRPVGEI